MFGISIEQCKIMVTKPASELGALVYQHGTRNVGQGCCQGSHSSLLLHQLLGCLLEVTDHSERHRVQEPDGIFARSFYYLCCRRNTYSFKFNSCFLLHLDSLVFFFVLVKADANPSSPSSTCSPRTMNVGFNTLWWRTLNNSINLKDV